MEVRSDEKGILKSMIFYSPKSHIKRLWKDIEWCAYEIAQMPKGEGRDMVAEAFKPRMDRARKLINSVLDYYYQEQNDEETMRFVQENRYTA